MRDIIKLSLILLVITVVSAGALSVTNDLTKGIIQEKALEANIVYMKEILPDADDFAALDNPEIESIDNVVEAYEALKGGSTMGYVVKTVTGGYGGDVEVLTGILTDSTVAGVKVASQSETPGLGTKITEDDFLDLFKEKSTETELEIVHGGGGDNSIESISGATVSSKAVSSGVNAAMKLYEEVFK